MFTLSSDPFGSVPFDREKVRRYVDSSRRLSDQITSLSRVSDEQSPTILTTATTIKPSGGTVITIGENNQYTISNNNNLVVGNNNKADKSISSSSQGMLILGGTVVDREGVVIDLDHSGSVRREIKSLSPSHSPSHWQRFA